MMLTATSIPADHYVLSLTVEGAELTVHTGDGARAVHTARQGSILGSQTPVKRSETYATGPLQRALLHLIPTKPLRL